MAWDLVRVVVVARLAAGARLIPMDQAQAAVGAIQRKLQDHYPDWEAMATAYDAMVRQKGFDAKGVSETLNRWIAGEVERTAAAVTTGIETYKFNEAAVAIYDFTWGTFCDWYLELAKPILNGDDETAKAETRATTAWVLDQILKLLHPFMPFISEELWDRLVEVGVKREKMLCLSAWPHPTGLADLHGGRLDIESALGEGSCFRLVLPLDVDAREAITEAAVEAPHEVPEPASETVLPPPVALVA